MREWRFIPNLDRRHVLETSCVRDGMRGLDSSAKQSPRHDQKDTTRLKGFANHARYPMHTARLLLAASAPHGRAAIPPRVDRKSRHHEPVLDLEL